MDVTGTDYHEVLRNGSVDALLGRFGTEPPDDLVRGPVMSREEWVLGVARSHPLASRDVAEPAPVRPRLGNPGYGDWPGPRVLD